MSKEFYIHPQESIPWTEATSRFGAMTYDNVLIRPNSDTHVESRKDANTSVKFGPYNLQVPIVSAPMDTITGKRMAIALNKFGAMGSLPRGDLGKRLSICEELSEHDIPCLYAIGLKKGFMEATNLKERGAQMVLLDVAHGGLEMVKRLAGEIKNRLELCVVAGNIATFEQASQYKQMGIDIARVGVGPGSACTTRKKTGVGYPQLSAIFETTESGIYTIADGGIRHPGDVAKALAAGANMVMIGGMFAGTEETPGEVLDGKKIFRGQASKTYMDDNGVKTDGHRTDEGITTTVPLRGSVEHIIHDVMGGLRSAMTYVGATDIASFQRDSQFIYLAPGAQAENNAHILDRT